MIATHSLMGSNSADTYRYGELGVEEPSSPDKRDFHETE
ncbi:hypothetical protein PJE062_2920 [Pseudovibrio sp. JE062]|nr:hypothetical protein PJE062_2920 [Pseudovibrio sp. JE062]